MDKNCEPGKTLAFAPFQPKSDRNNFQAGLLAWPATTTFSRHTAQWCFNSVAEFLLYRPHSGGDHAGFAPASLFSRNRVRVCEHLKAMKRTCQSEAAP